jgi:hypothetical protein
MPASTIFAKLQIRPFLYLLLKMETSGLLILHFLDKIYRNSDESNAKNSGLHWIVVWNNGGCAGIFFLNKTKISQ